MSLPETGDYLRDPDAIYRESRRIIESEANLARLDDDTRPLAVRLIHACGMTDLVGDLALSPGAVARGRQALEAGAAILCDVEMVARGVIASRLPAGNAVVCRLNDPAVPDLAKTRATTRSAAAVDLWDGHLDNAVVAIGNAPTALFRLLEKIEDGDARPALVIGMPVGFVGAAESKLALAESGLPFITVHGRRGGSALAAAAVNALMGGIP
ncbi:MAG: precorrin-8X methylmutase [Pseudomonadota bacterium]